MRENCNLRPVIGLFSALSRRRVGRKQSRGFALFVESRGSRSERVSYRGSREFWPSMSVEARPNRGPRFAIPFSPGRFGHWGISDGEL